MDGEKLELKPCPHCGDRLIKSEPLSTRSYDCMIHPAGDDAADPCINEGIIIHGNNSERIAAWNRRTPAIGEAELVAALRAIAEGYHVTTHDDRYIRVENPSYQPDNGEGPFLVIDTRVLTKGPTHAG